MDSSQTTNAEHHNHNKPEGLLAFSICFASRADILVLMAVTTKAFSLVATTSGVMAINFGLKSTANNFRISGQSAHGNLLFLPDPEENQWKQNKQHKDIDVCMKIRQERQSKLSLHA